MRIRPIEPRDRQAWAQMRAQLWPSEDPDQLGHETLVHFSGKPLAEAIFVAEDKDGALCGFLELSLRPYAEGCATSPVPFVEAWFVWPGARFKGVGRTLVEAAENWALVRNFSEIASDTELDNAVSQEAHGALGFAEVQRLVAFRKPLRQ